MLNVVRGIWEYRCAFKITYFYVYWFILYKNKSNKSIVVPQSLGKKWGITVYIIL